MINRHFHELFARIKSWRAPSAAPAKPRNGGLPLHLQPEPWIPRRRQSDGWTRVETVAELVAVAGLQMRCPRGTVLTVIAN
jgi:hypothetical protein